MKSRVISIDFGYKNIGIAVSDALGITAQPLSTLRRTSVENDIAHILRQVEEYSAGQIVVGLPILLDGSEGELSRAARSFGARLSAAGASVEYFDERMTTSVVDRMLTEEADVSRAKRKKVRDRLAAVLILQNYLDSKAIEEPRSEL